MPTLIDATALAGDLVDLRHTLHRHPELGLQLPVTQATVLEALSGLDLEISTGAATTSATSSRYTGLPPSAPTTRTAS